MEGLRSHPGGVKGHNEPVALKPRGTGSLQTQGYRNYEKRRVAAHPLPQVSQLRSGVLVL